MRLQYMFNAVSVCDLVAAAYAFTLHTKLLINTTHIVFVITLPPSQLTKASIPTNMANDAIKIVNRTAKEMVVTLPRVVSRKKY